MSVLVCSQEAIKGTLHFNNASMGGDLVALLKCELTADI